MNKDAELMFELCDQAAKTYGTMLLGALINEAQGVDATALHAAANSMLDNLKNQVKLAVKVRGNEQAN